MQELLALPKSEASQSQPVDSSPIWPAVNRVKCGTLSSAEFIDPTAFRRCFGADRQSGAESGAVSARIGSSDVASQLDRA